MPAPNAMDKNKNKEKEKTGNIEFPDQKIVPVRMENTVQTSFIDYSMSVITSRALPDARDGMKPGQRRILYAMYEDHLTYDKPFRKSATTVGNVLGRYHPHGDVAVYQTMVRMAQPFSLRYTLVEGHGNFGNVDGDGAAAYRYTEARMSRLADYMMSDIEKEVVDFVPNYDNSRREPVVLPARFPNLLVNGSVGIAVGMATNIPPHNLSEVVDGTIYYMDHPDATVPELMQFIKGPDFPTSASICGTAGILRAYTTGQGRIYVRAKCEIEEEHHRIIVTEIPYQVNKSMLVESIANLYKDKRIEGIRGLRDESGRNGMRIVIEYKHDANGQIILNQLYKYTQLQDTCAVNMLALVNGEPKILNLPQILDIYIRHQESVVTRRVQFDLDKALREMHILEGYQIAIDNIDEIVEMIKKSASIADSKASLIARFSLSDLQAQAIVDMPLGRLSGLERQKIEDRLAKLKDIVADLRAILADENRIKDIIKQEMLEMKNRFGDARRTEITESDDEIVLEDMIERHTCVITLTHAGYIKRQPSDTYTAQNRGGKGIIGMGTKEEDFVEKVAAVHSHDNLLLFTNRGRVHMRRAFQIPEASRTAKGTNIVNLLELAPGESVTSIISIHSFADGGYLTMVTRQGVIKRTLLSEYEYQRKTGKIALNLDEGDELVFIKHTHGDSELILATRNGNAVKFHEENVRCMGRTARGVKGITLAEGDYVVGVAVVEEGKKLITITEKGYGKRTEFEDFRTMLHRGGRGVCCHNITEKTGPLASVATVDDNDDVMLITKDGTIIRTPVSSIPVYSRAASGVIVMRTGDSRIVNFTKVEHINEEELEAVKNAEVPEPDTAEKENGEAWDAETEEKENGEKPEDDGEI